MKKNKKNAAAFRTKGAKGGTGDVIASIGKTVNSLRTAKGLTLQSLSKRANLSVSMLSLIERGKASPSIGSLVVLASALGVEMTDLIGNGSSKTDRLVSRAKEQKVVQTNDGVMRRIVKTDATHGIEIAINEYDVATANSPKPVKHQGFEYGIVLQGELQITVDGVKNTLMAGDLISYPSTHPHRIVNSGSKRARALWINLKRE
ncbi:MAG TPA: cupin domain-containing protein [Pseudolabrys sp.]|nr:cupin domain-containing protein [Pseudolabrys sp.]